MSIENTHWLIVSDLDGTLLSIDKIISDQNLVAIAKVIKNSHVFALATGRSFYSANRVLDSLKPYDIPIICCNGAYITSSKKLNKTFSVYLEHTAAKQIISLANKLNVSLIMWENEKLYVNRIDDLTRKYAKGLDLSLIIIDDKTPMKKIDKIIMIASTLNMPLVIEQVNKMNINANYFTSDRTYLEFVNKATSKKQGVIELAKLNNIDQEHIMCIGDGYNDLDMIKYAHVGVAMENSTERIKEQADFITVSNNNNGVAYALKKYILNND